MFVKNSSNKFVKKRRIICQVVIFWWWTAVRVHLRSAPPSRSKPAPSPAPRRRAPAPGARGRRTWALNSNLELCLFPFPGIRFRFPFSPYPPFSLFPGNVSAFFCKIHKLPVILCHFPQFRRNSVKFAAKNAWFSEKFANFPKIRELQRKNAK